MSAGDAQLSADEREAIREQIDRLGLVVDDMDRESTRAVWRRYACAALQRSSPEGAVRDADRMMVLERERVF